LYKLSMRQFHFPLKRGNTMSMLISLHYKKKKKQKCFGLLINYPPANYHKERIVSLLWKNALFISFYKLHYMWGNDKTNKTA
jgi:hypothetical protein